MTKAACRLPEVAVPLGTYTGWNVTVPPLNDLELSGGTGRIVRAVCSYAARARTIRRPAPVDRRALQRTQGLSQPRVTGGGRISCGNVFSCRKTSARCCAEPTRCGRRSSTASLRSTASLFVSRSPSEIPRALRVLRGEESFHGTAAIGQQRPESLGAQLRHDDRGRPRPIQQDGQPQRWRRPAACWTSAWTPA